MPDTPVKLLQYELARLHEHKESLKAGYRETFEFAGVGIAHVAPAGDILEANARFCEMMGVSQAKLGGLRFQDITFHDDIEPNISKLRSLMQGEIVGYRMQKRYVRSSGEVFWADLTVSAVRDDDNRPVRLIAVVNDISREKAAEERLRFLTDELSHRTKNLISVIQAIVGQTCATYAKPDEIRTVLAGRLRGIAASQSALTGQEDTSASIRTLVEFHLSAFLSSDDVRITVDGPNLNLTSAAARAIGLALHELATNACKYGALSSAAGRIEIAWKIEEAESNRLHMSWSESGGPVVLPPARRGFGRTVVEQMVATATRGEVALEFDPEGITWHLSAPVEAVRA